MIKRASAAIFVLLGAVAVPAWAQDQKPPPADAPKAGDAAGETNPPASTPEKPPEGPAPADVDVAKDQTSALAVYQKALEARKLSASSSLSTQRLKDELENIEDMIVNGRRDEAIGALVYIVESPRFEPFASTEEGRASTYLLGDALGRAGAYDLARSYLRKLLAGTASETWYRKSVHSLVDFGLESDEPDPFLADLKPVPDAASDELRGDIEYLAGRAAELRQKPEDALSHFAKVGEKSRFWAQATYLSGVLEVERKHLKQGENLFCKVADPKRTPKQAAVFGGTDFFRVRDMARLGLGRVAHEQYRFDDARYYYYLVPADSERLPEALYETATTRYEAKDYEGAREAMEELGRQSQTHPYQDEAWILDSYIDLALCRFPQADDKLQKFIKIYEPVRDAARKLTQDEQAMQRLVEAVRRSTDPAAANLGFADDTARSLGTLLRVDTGYGRSTRRLAELDHQMNGLNRAMGDLEQAERHVDNAKEAKPSGDSKLGRSDSEEISRVEAQVAEVKRLLREAERASGARKSEVDDLRKQLEALELEVRAARAAGPLVERAAREGQGLGALLLSDRDRASALYSEAATLRENVRKEQLAFAKDAFVRLDQRLSRLLRRARLGRIETVLGKKRALELEVEALGQGLLPQTIVDSLDAARYLQDNEEYWPFEGEDWADEYVGGENLK